MCKDLEFIQMLSNPKYVIELVDRGYFSDKNFVEYLDKLSIFLKSPKLFKLVKFSEGLYNLKLILERGFEYSLKEDVNRHKFILSCLKRNEEIRAKDQIITFTRFHSLELQEKINRNEVGKNLEQPGSLKNIGAEKAGDEAFKKERSSHSK